MTEELSMTDRMARIAVLEAELIHLKKGLPGHFSEYLESSGNPVVDDLTSVISNASGIMGLHFAQKVALHLWDMVFDDREDALEMWGIYLRAERRSEGEAFCIASDDAAAGDVWERTDNLRWLSQGASMTMLLQRAFREINTGKIEWRAVPVHVAQGEEG